MQDHRRIKRLTGQGLGFSSLRTARRTLAGYEAVVTVGNGQIRQIGNCDMNAQRAFVAELFQIAAWPEPIIITRLTFYVIVTEQTMSSP
jgi:hypothetical protein